MTKVRNIAPIKTLCVVLTLFLSLFVVYAIVAFYV